MMIKKVIGVLAVALLATTIANVAQLGLFKKEGQRMVKQADVSFIDFSLQKQDIGRLLRASQLRFASTNGKEMVLYYGQVRWNEQSGACGTPAEVPVEIFKPVYEEKRLIPKAAYSPSASGEFYFAVEKLDTDYVLAAFPQRGYPKNLPDKVREFLEEMKEKDKGYGNNWPGTGNQIH
jgi:hypothetical protein